MANQYLVSEIIAALRDTGMIPDADGAFTTDRLIAVCNREQRLYLTRLLVSIGGGSYQTATKDVPIVPGQERYRLPSRAVVAGLQRVELVTDTMKVPLNIVPFERDFEERMWGTGDCTIEGMELVLLGQLQAGRSIRFTYTRRLGKLVTAEEVGEVTNINRTTGEVTVSALPTSFAASKRYDFIQGEPHFDTLAEDVQPSSIAGNIITFAMDDIPDELVVGDFVCLAGETPICQAPPELHDVLVQRACVAVLQSLGDPKAAMAERKLAEMRDDAIALLQPRLKGAPNLVQNFNGPGWFRVHRRGRIVR